jgi:hypothetical protein
MRLVSAPDGYFRFFPNRTRSTEGGRVSNVQRLLEGIPPSAWPSLSIRDQAFACELVINRKPGMKGFLVSDDADDYCKNG